VNPRVPEPAPAEMLLLCFVLAALFIGVVRGCGPHTPPDTSYLRSP